MNNRPFRWLLSSLLICPLLLSAQIKTKHLKGSWFTSDTDSLYYTADTLHLFQDSQHFNSSKDCQMVEWHFEKRMFNQTHFNHCTSRDKLRVRQEFSLHKEDFGQVLTLSQNGKVVNQFKVLNFLKKPNRQGLQRKGYLQLQRFDQPGEYRLYRYVDSIVHQVLKWDPEQTEEETVTISHINSKYVKVTCRGSISDRQSRKPLLIINGRPVDSYEVLKKLRMVEVFHIKYLDRIEAPPLYGIRGSNGVIILSVSEKSFRRAARAPIQRSLDTIR